MVRCQTVCLSKERALLDRYNSFLGPTVSSRLSVSRWLTARMTPTRHGQREISASSGGASPLTHRNRFPTSPVRASTTAAAAAMDGPFRHTERAQKPLGKLQHRRPTDRTLTTGELVNGTKEEKKEKKLKKGKARIRSFCVSTATRRGDLNFFQPPPANSRSYAPRHSTLETQHCRL